MVRTKFTSTLAIATAVGMSLMLSACDDDNNNSATSTPAPTPTPAVSEQNALTTATPIKHLVVIFGENESFDHYFGTYPNAQNPAGEPTDTWTAPSGHFPNNYNAHPQLLTANPNTTNASNLALTNPVVPGTTIPASYLNPFRIDRAQYDTSSQGHGYTAEQNASDNLKMDAFAAFTGATNTSGVVPAGAAAAFATKAQVMGYFDGNTVTAMWNYAQNYAMSDNAYTDTFGPSTPGAINVISGSTAGAKGFINGVATNGAVAGSYIEDSTGTNTYTVIGDPDPAFDACSTKTGGTVQLGGKNIGDLLTAAKITWGGFMGGFDRTITNANGSNTAAGGVTGCGRSSVELTGRTTTDYIPHHAWFQYYASTANINHTRPTSTALIGHNEANDAPNGATAVNHQYDYNDFVTAVKAGNFPSVSYIKAPAVGDAHPGNSNPLDEQLFDTQVINFVMSQPDWKTTAIIIAYDDSDGWYDHVAPTILTSSFDGTADTLTSAGVCDGPSAMRGRGVNGSLINGRCGPGTRTPFIVISPYAKQNYVSNVALTQSSVIKFIEDNWLGGARLGGGSNDATAGDIRDMFDFSTTATPRTALFCIDPSTGKKVAQASGATSCVIPTSST